MLLRSDSGIRRTVVAEVTAAVHAAVTGVGERTLMLTAGPGAGKTYLLRQIAYGTAVATRWATGDELSWRRPYGMAAEQLGIELPATIPPHFDQVLLARIDELCAQGPLLLVVDDAHHADAGTLGLLNVLAGTARHLPLALVVAWRSVPVRQQLITLAARPAVRDWTLPAMDSADIEMLAHSRLGAWPNPRLLERLVTTGGNPMHTTALMDQLDRAGAIEILGDSAELKSGVDSSPVGTLEESVSERLSLLDAPARTLLQKLAVWGSAATLADLAAIDGSNPAALLEPVQVAMDGGIVTLSDDGRLAFAHDLYAEVTYERLAPALRTLLHTAIAEWTSKNGDAQSVAHHLVAAGAPHALDAVRAATEELAAAPAVAVDLLDNAVAHTVGGSNAANELAVSRAWALAHSGQMQRASDVAEAALAATDDADSIAALRQVLIFSLLTQGLTDRVLEMIDSTQALEIDDATRTSLNDFRSWVLLLDGRHPVPITPSTVVTKESTQIGLLAESVRQFLIGNGPAGVEIAIFATARDAADVAEENSAADLMPPFIETYTRGAEAAAELMAEIDQENYISSTRWADPFRHFIAGSIDLYRSRLDDAAAHYDTGADILEASGLARTSHYVGPRTVIDIYKGDLTAATDRLASWDASSMPDQFGMALTHHARVLLLEARGNLPAAAEFARNTWEQLIAHRQVTMARLHSADFARVAVRAGDTRLVHAIDSFLTTEQTHITPAAAPSVTLASALTGNHLDTEALARTAADAALALGNRILVACAWEEAACAAATGGDRTAARDHARNALVTLDDIGAAAMGRRVTSRLRAVGVRLGATGARRRPSTGWESLTPTELRVTELIASGLSGTEVARQLYISPRTVQTHVSHAINKIGARTRVELAMMARSR
ncbi:LuxR C-terminal-related transcriptional regulator [Rhodococcoides yunnanense]|uniref:LuxR C-terminal-related transcriptional regulator n=1 Tax=Rhodococcoides yunnanense TaxID=278209 RepID=UPI00093546E7|nr:LuxR C-terminal-related transcriptional regulator [Rhodococcus yunnanensis]